MFESKKQRYKNCEVKSPNAYACKSESSSKAKYLSKQRRNKLFVAGLFFFAFVFCVSAMFIAPNKMTPQTTTPNPVNALNPSGDCGTNATYTFDSATGTLTISGTGPMKDYGYYDGDIEEWDGEPTPYFGLEITSVKIGSGVTSIGNGAFSGLTNLTGVEISSSVKTIGNYAFYYCTGLTSIAIPNSVTSIGDSAFGYFGLTSVTIPDSVTSIGNYTFYGGSLTSITMGLGVASIGKNAFYGCYYLESVYYTGTIEQWCNIDFVDGLSNPLHYAHNLYINNKLVTELNIPNTVTQIRQYAFADYSKLTSIKIPNSVTSIGDSAFSNCSNLTSVTFAENSQLKSIVEYAFSYCSGLTSITIPNSVESIGDYAFKGCSKLESVTIRFWVNSIGRMAFSDCSADLIICGDTSSTAYSYAKSYKINYATAWVTNATTHTRKFYGFKTNSNATAETQTGNHNFGADGMAGTCSVCGVKNENVSTITLNVTTNVSRYFVIYVLDSNNQPIRQFAVTNGDTIVFTVAKSSALFTIQVYETLYMSATIDGTKTLKRTYTNLTGDTTIEIEISGVMNVNNWVII